MNFRIVGHAERHKLLLVDPLIAKRVKEAPEERIPLQARVIGTR